MEKVRLQSLLTGFADRKVLVVGDCMLDEYLWGRVTRISPEAPVPVVELVETTYAAGGASNVAANIVSLGGEASLVAIVGEDVLAGTLKEQLGLRGIRHDGLVADAARPTTVKTRVMAHNQQMIRVDRERRTPATPDVSARLIQAVEDQLDWADALVFSDYSKGTLCEEVVLALTKAAHRRGRLVFANAKPGSIGWYQQADLISLNQVEAETVTGLSLAAIESVHLAGERIMELCRAHAVVITLGGRGLAVFQRGAPARHLPVLPLDVYDPCGCGDSAIAAAALARVAGADWVEAATLANLAGNAKVRKLGIVAITRPEIEGVWAVSDAIANGTR